MPRIHKHHFYFGIVLFVLGGMAIYFVSSGGYYPVALVNGEPVLARELRTITDSAFNFYLRAFDTYKKQPISEADAQNLLREVKRATLEKLIEERLLAGEVTSRFGDSLETLLDTKLKSVENDNLRQAVSSVYGLSPEDFRATVLEPQATRELLVESFKQKNEDFAAWLAGQKQAASVYVLLPGFDWSGATLEVK